MENNDGKIVKFTNISDKDFTHPFGGMPYFVKAGETMMFPYYLGKHLAKHLARRIFLDGDKSASTYDPSDKTGGTGAPLWNDAQEADMMNRILSDVYEEQRPAQKSEMDLLREQVEALNSLMTSKDEAPLVSSETDVTTYKDKAQVIQALKDREIPYDARKTKAELLKLLE
jgi:hypothetical protein